MDLLYITESEIKLFEIPQNWTKLFEDTQCWMKMFHLAQIWMELLPFGQSWFNLVEFTQIFQFMETFLTSSKFGCFWMKLSQSAPNLDEIVPICSHFIEVDKMSRNDSNFIQIWIKLLSFTQTFLNVLTFQWSYSI